MAELAMLRGVAGPGVDMADVRPALAAADCPAGAFRFGGIVAVLDCPGSSTGLRFGFSSRISFIDAVLGFLFPERLKMGDLRDGGGGGGGWKEQSEWKMQPGSRPST
jgi:hypothetical protein